MKEMASVYRVTKGPQASDWHNGPNGFFVFPHYRIHGYEIRCMSSNGLGWDHVSVTVAAKNQNSTRCPTWEEMCWVKDQFWNKDEVVWQYHPAESNYVSDHHFCLHLWSKQNFEMPTPDPIMVGRTKGQKL
jgi:hypothetical protein